MVCLYQVSLLFLILIPIVMSTRLDRFSRFSMLSTAINTTTKGSSKSSGINKENKRIINNTKNHNQTTKLNMVGKGAKGERQTNQFDLSSRTSTKQEYLHPATLSGTTTTNYLLNHGLETHSFLQEQHHPFYYLLNKRQEVSSSSSVSTRGEQVSLHHHQLDQLEKEYTTNFFEPNEKEDSPDDQDKIKYITHGLIPSSIQIRQCNQVLKEAFLSSIHDCQMDYIPTNNEPKKHAGDLYLEWLDNYTSQVCENEKCFNSGVKFAEKVYKVCPRNYIGRIEFNANNSTTQDLNNDASSTTKTTSTTNTLSSFVIYANATAWVTPVNQKFVNQFPVCTRDVTKELCVIKIRRNLIAAKKKVDKRLRKDTICSRCSALLVKSITDMSNAPPYQGIALSNPMLKKMEKNEMLNHMNVLCGEDFLPRTLSHYQKLDQDQTSSAVATFSYFTASSSSFSNTMVGLFSVISLVFHDVMDNAFVFQKIWYGHLQTYQFWSFMSTIGILLL